MASVGGQASYTSWPIGISMKHWDYGIGLLPTLEQV